MKILMCSLFLTIEFFLHIGELEAPKVAGTSLGSGRTSGGYLLYVEKTPRDGEPHKIVQIGSQTVHLWLDISRKHVLKAWYPEGCAIPRAGFYKHEDFLIRLCKVERLKVVIYISKNNAFIGARAPKQPGDGYRLEPTEKEWYLIYSATNFKLQVNTTTEIITGISLLKGNAIQPRDVFDNVEVAKVKFRVFRNEPNGTITGALLRSP